jgi:RNA polymerase sigma-70 factor, ECF subfamily
LAVTEPCGLSFTDLHDLSDEEIMLHIQGGHDDALTVLFDRYHRLVLSIGYKILRDAGEAEDVSQSVFLELYQVAAQFDPGRGTTKAWLLQYAYNRSLNRKRYLVRRDFYSVKGQERSLLQVEEPGTNGVFRTVEARKMLHDAIEDLSPAQKKTIHMVHFEGLSLPEIAEKTGETVCNVRHHYYRGLGRMRNRMTEQKVGTENSTKDKVPLRRGIVDAEA